MDKIASVSDYLNRQSTFRTEIEQLRSIVLSTGLEETIKWGLPCYVHNKKNVLGIAAFDEYVGIWFYQGALITDKGKHLINAQEGKTKAMRQWRFSNQEEIKKHLDLIKAYIQESILNFEQGNEIKPSRNKPLEIPTELKTIFDSNKTVREAFESLNLTKKREYCEYIASAKRSETKQKRLDKILPMISELKGLHDKYR